MCTKLLQLLLTGLFIISAYSLAAGQDKVDFENYKSIESDGPLPKIFTRYAKLELDEQIIPTSADADISAGKIKKKVEEFTTNVSYSYNQLLSGGRLLFGDPITSYINNVAKIVLKDHPDLLKELTFYTYKSSSINASCVSNGTIYINIGLIAKLNSEAELAFVIAHEAAHYVKNHLFNSYIERYKVSQGAGDYAKLTYEETVDLSYTFSKDHELEADAWGFEVFAKTDYTPDALEKVFHILNYFYLPYREMPIDKALFNVDNLVVPLSYFKESLSPILPVRDYNERWDSHPNTVMRLKQIDEVLDGKAKGDKLFIFSESEFTYVRKIARFESIQLELMRREYGSAIYLAQILMKEYPDNEYLESSVAKALYGLAKYKNADEYHMAARPYMKAEGESQQIHYLLRKFTAKQLNIIAIKYLMKVSEKYPGGEILEGMKTDLFEDLVVKYELKPGDFYNEGDEISKNDKFFYKLAFQDELKDKDFELEFSNHYAELKEEKRKEERTYKQVISEERKEEKRLKEEGLDLYAKKIMVVDPVYIVIGKKGLDIELSKEKKLLFDGNIRKAAMKSKIEVSFLSLADLHGRNTETYNMMSQFKFWAQEKYSHGQLDLLLLCSDHSDDLAINFGTNLVYYPSITYIRLLNMTYIERYIYNLESGKTEYTDVAAITGKPGMTAINKLIIKDFNLIIN